MGKGFLGNRNFYKAILLIFSFIVIYQLIGISIIGASNYYSIQWYRTHSNDADSVTLYSPNVTTSNAQITLTGRGSFNGSSYDATASYYSPLNNLISSSERSFTGNKSCQNFGSVYVDYFETEIRLTDDADESSITSNVLFELSPSVKNIEFRINTYPYDNDNSSYNTFLDVDEVSGVTLSQSILNSEVINDMNDFSSNFNQCYGKFAGGGRYEKTFVTVSSQKYFIHTRFFVFNSSSSGAINYSFSISNTGCLSGLPQTQDFYNVGYYKLSNPVFTNLSISSSGSGSLVLDSSGIYVFQVTTGVGTTGSSGSSVTYREHLYNNSIVINTAIPEWECGDWSECEDGSQQRSCIDSSGEVSGRIETRSCYSLPEKSIVIGFENSTEVNVFYSYPTWWVISCPFYVGYKTVEYPSDWNVNNISNPRINHTGVSPNVLGYVLDDILISNTESYEGTKSLKLWSLPPEQYIPICPDGFISDLKNCSLTPYGNYTNAHFPSLTKEINESYMLSRNITFDYPNMTLSMYIKKCKEPVQEWSGNTSFYGLCGDGYYTSDKKADHDVSKTSITFAIWDYNISRYVANARFKTDSFDWSKKELRLENMTTDHLYKFYLGVSLESSVDNNVYCAYLDNIEINAYTGTFPCSSYCLGSTRYTATRIGEYGCVYDIVTPHEACINPDYITELETCKSFCDCKSDSEHYLTYYQATNNTDQCEWDLIDDSSYCEDYCAEQDISDVDDIFKDYLRSKNIDERYDPLFSFTMIIFYIVIIVISLLAYATKSWEIGALVGFLLLMAFGTVFKELSWLVALVIIVAGIWFGNMIRNRKSNG